MKKALETLRLRYKRPEDLAWDPLSIPLEYAGDCHRELAAFVASMLAYGRVKPMMAAIRRALAPLGPEPASWLRERDEATAREDLSQALEGWVWRFHKAGDLVEWLLAWKRLDAESGGRGLESHLLPGPGASADERLSNLVQRLRIELPPTRGLRFNLSDPLEGSACKRWRLFLRWVARRGWPDLGLWRDYPVSDLVIPLDTHVSRIARLIGLTRRQASDGRTAREITEALCRLCPEDPLRYDFALSHLGIQGDCLRDSRRSRCAGCPLWTLCSLRS